MMATSNKVGKVQVPEGSDPVRPKKRFYDGRYGHTSIHVHPGDTYVTKDPGEMIVTVLGSCIAVCIRDRRLGLGGLNHFMLPDSPVDKTAGRAMRYGAFAMESLINEILKRGGARNNLEIKVFGGAQMMGLKSDVGRRNIEFIKKYLAQEHFAIEASNVGGERARRIHYFPTTGKVQMKLLGSNEASIVATEERTWAETIENRPIEGELDLF